MGPPKPFKNQKFEEPLGDLTPTTTKLSGVIKHQSYWESSEARRIFNPNEDERVLTAINRRIDMLKAAVSMCDGYKIVLNEMKGEAEVDDGVYEQKKLTDYDKYEVRKKSVYLLALYKVVEENMPKTTLMECCEKSISICSREGWDITNKWTLQRWQKQF